MVTQAAKAVKQIDYEFVIEPVTGSANFRIKLASSKGSQVPYRLDGMWTSVREATRAIDSWRGSLVNSLGNVE